MEGEGRAKRSSPRTSPSHCPGPWSSRNISAVWGVRGKEVYEEPGHIKQCGTPQTTPSIAPHKPQLLHTTQSTTPSACRIKSSPSIQVPLQLAHSFSFQSRLLYPCMTTGKIKALTRLTFVSKVMPLLFDMLSRMVIAFLPRSKRLNFMAAVTICSDFGAPKNKSLTLFPLFPHLFAILQKTPHMHTYMYYTHYKHTGIWSVYVCLWIMM